jgi:hypothetical protein
MMAAIKMDLLIVGVIGKLGVFNLIFSLWLKKQVSAVDGANG